MNERSSRSHTVFTVNIFQRNKETEHSKFGKLYLVDLAGSEKLYNSSGVMCEETKNINKSLLCLGNVIKTLTSKQNKENVYIPFRNSKLTRLLQECFGGNSLTTLIVTCSPALINIKESISTLRFGIKAKKICNKIIGNSHKSVKELISIIKNHERTITELNSRIAILEEDNKKLIENKASKLKLKITEYNENENDTFYIKQRHSNNNTKCGKKLAFLTTRNKKSVYFKKSNDLNDIKMISNDDINREDDRDSKFKTKSSNDISTLSKKHNSFINSNNELNPFSSDLKDLKIINSFRPKSTKPNINKKNIIFNINNLVNVNSNVSNLPNMDNLLNKYIKECTSSLFERTNFNFCLLNKYNNAPNNENIEYMSNHKSSSRISQKSILSKASKSNLIKTTTKRDVNMNIADNKRKKTKSNSYFSLTTNNQHKQEMELFIIRLLDISNAVVQDIKENAVILEKGNMNNTNGNFYLDNNNKAFITYLDDLRELIHNNQEIIAKIFDIDTAELENSLSYFYTNIKALKDMNNNIPSNSGNIQNNLSLSILNASSTISSPLANNVMYKDKRNDKDYNKAFRNREDNTNLLLYDKNESYLKFIVSIESFTIKNTSKPGDNRNRFNILDYEIERINKAKTSRLSKDSIKENYLNTKLNDFNDNSSSLSIFRKQIDSLLEENKMLKKHVISKESELSKLVRKLNLMENQIVLFISKNKIKDKSLNTDIKDDSKTNFNKEINNKRKFNSIKESIKFELTNKLVKRNANDSKIISFINGGKDTSKRVDSIEDISKKNTSYMGSNEGLEKKNENNSNDSVKAFFAPSNSGYYSLINKLNYIDNEQIKLLDSNLNLFINKDSKKIDETNNLNINNSDNRHVDVFSSINTRFSFDNELNKKYLKRYIKKINPSNRNLDISSNTFSNIERNSSITNNFNNLSLNITKHFNSNKNKTDKETFLENNSIVDSHQTLKCISEYKEINNNDISKTVKTNVDSTNSINSTNNTNKKSLLDIFNK